MQMDLDKVRYALSSALAKCDPRDGSVSPAGRMFGAYVTDVGTSTTMAEILRDGLAELDKAPAIHTLDITGAR